MDKNPQSGLYWIIVFSFARAVGPGWRHRSFNRFTAPGWCFPKAGTWKVTGAQKERIFFQPSFVRGELLNFQGVISAVFFLGRTKYPGYRLWFFVSPTGKDCINNKLQIKTLSPSKLPTSILLTLYKRNSNQNWTTSGVFPFSFTKKGSDPSRTWFDATSNCSLGWLSISKTPPKQTRKKTELQ